MSSFFTDLEAQLAGAARAQTAAHGADWRGRGRDRGRRARGAGGVRRTARVVPVSVTVLTAVAIAVLALTPACTMRARGNASHGSASPPPSSNGPIQLLPSNPNRTQRQEITYLYDAQEAAARRTRSATATGHWPASAIPGRRPSLSQADPSAATLAILGVLRRPAVPSDKLPPRLIGAPHISTYIPTARSRRSRTSTSATSAKPDTASAPTTTSFRPATSTTSSQSRRDAGLSSALHSGRSCPTIPARLRAGVLALETLFVTQQRHNDLPYPGVCLIGINDTGNGGGGCDAGGSLSQIEDGTGAMPSGAPTGVGVVDGLVPDGVRTVTFEYKRHRPVTVLSINNVFIVRRQGLPNYGFPNTIVWRAADGRIIKVIHRP